MRVFQVVLNETRRLVFEVVAESAEEAEQIALTSDELPQQDDYLERQIDGTTEMPPS